MSLDVRQNRTKSNNCPAHQSPISFPRVFLRCVQCSMNSDLVGQRFHTHHQHTKIGDANEILLSRCLHNTTWETNMNGTFNEYICDLCWCFNLQINSNIESAHNSRLLLQIFLNKYPTNLVSVAVVRSKSMITSWWPPMMRRFGAIWIIQTRLVIFIERCVNFGIPLRIWCLNVVDVNAKIPLSMVKMSRTISLACTWNDVYFCIAPV